MKNASRRYSSTMMAMIAAGVAVVTIEVGAAGAAESCLSGPKGETPKGQHWFYRVDHATKRHCWFLGDAGRTASSSRVATSGPARRAESASAGDVDPSRASKKALPAPIADARAEVQTSRSLSENNADTSDNGSNDNAPAVGSERLASVAAPEDSERGSAADASVANPDRSPEVSALPQPNGVASSAGAPATINAMKQAGAPRANTDVITATTASAIAPTGSENSAIGTTPYLIGLTLVILGALICLGPAVYRLAERRTRRRSHGSFGDEPPHGARPATPPPFNVDDNLRRMSEMLARLQHEAQPASEARLYSRQR